MKQREQQYEVKSDYEGFLDELMHPLSKYYLGNDPNFNSPNYYATSYSDDILCLESFSRPLWGYIYGSFDEKIILNIFSLIIKGTDSNSTSYWGKLEDYSQMIVEMVPIALFCLRYKRIFFNFAKDIREQIGNWLYQINNVKISMNNWQCFLLLVNTVLKQVNLAYSQDRIETAKKNIEMLYVGDGWYCDGNNSQADYYIAFGFHYYLLLYTLISDNDKTVSIYKNRAFVFSKTFKSWFADTGDALPFGRSLTYKFAQSAFWSIFLVSKIDPSNESEYKGILNRNLIWWQRQNIKDSCGFLTLGYSYHNHTITEYYNGTSSSYWALKAFAILLLDKTDSVFLIKEKRSINVENKIIIHPCRMHVLRRNGQVYSFVNGQHCVNNFGHTECKYEKFVYSTLFGFSISKSYTSLELLACDCSLAISLNGGDYFARHNSVPVDFSPELYSSVWQPIKSVRIKTIIIPSVPEHVRIHFIESKVDFDLFDGGFSVSINPSFMSKVKNAIAIAKNNSQYSFSYSAFGGGEAIIIRPVPNVNLLYPRTVIPGVKYHIDAGKSVICDVFGGDVNYSFDKIYSNQPTVRLFDHFLEVEGKKIELGTTQIHHPNKTIDYLKKIKKFLYSLGSKI